jgi:DNA uptake protein ComE-like DNA-binding protein
MKHLSVWALSLGAAACGGAGEIGISEDALSAASVLAFVNSAEATLEVLDEDVGLDVRAARGIARHVRGRDGRFATRDDNPFDTIAELDAIPYVGQRAFDLLDTFVRARAADLEIEGVSLTNAQAEEIVRVANEATLDELDTDVGLDARAAARIVAARPIADIIALGSVAFVGRVAIERLRDYAALSRPSIPITSDTTWRTLGADALSDSPGEGWFEPDFDDTRWPLAVSAPTSCGATWPDEPNSLPMWPTDDRFAAFFRKTFTVPEGGTVTRASLTVEADDDVAVYVNGVEVYMEEDFAVLEGNRIIRQTIDITSELTEGDNVIAMHAIDTVGGCRWLLASGRIDYRLP